MNKRVLILRGLPGSGKSTFVKEAKKMYDNVVVVSADDYHMIDSKYVYRQENAQRAHEACFDSFVKAIMSEEDCTIIVDNTNTTSREIMPYYIVAKNMDAHIQVHQFYCKPEVSFERNIHKVPFATISRMSENLKVDLPSDWGIHVHYDMGNRG